MVGSFPTTDPNNIDLLGDSKGPDTDIYSVGCPEPGKIVDLSGASSTFSAPQSHAPGSFGGGGSSTGFGASSRGPSSIEGGGGNGLSLSLSGISPANIMRQLASRPVSELVHEHGRQLLQVPRIAANAYQAAARRYLRPWSEFARIRPGRIVEGLRGASRRGEIQLHFQRNVLANARAFCPNYAFMFLCMLFMFVCTSPWLLVMLGGVGGAWSHALHNESFRTRPWQLQIGGASVPLGSNIKMAIMSLPTLLFLHFFMGPVLWSAALCSGGISVAHAALRDRDDDHHEPDDHGLESSQRIRELP